MDPGRTGRSRHWGRRPTALACSLAVLTFAGACSSDNRQELNAGPPGHVAPTTITPATIVAPPPPFDEVRARYEVVRAAAGHIVGRAPATLVDDVALRSPIRTRVGSRSRTVSSARRIRITGGPFPYGDARVVVLVDGRSLGEGQVSDRGRTLTVAVFDAGLVHDGVVISYRIEPRRPVTVGVLRIGG